jgi:hypothetical protein
MVVVVDKVFEERCLVNQFMQAGGTSSWSIPGDIVMALEKGKEMRPDVNWRVPDIRVVKNNDGILEGPYFHLTLRCFPCPDLNVFEGGLNF